MRLVYAFMAKVASCAAAAAVVLLAIPSVSDAAVRGEVSEIGVMVGDRSSDPSRERRGDAGLSPAIEMRGGRYVERTNRIEARLCRSFGMTVKVSADAPGEIPRRVDVRVLHPKFTRPDGATSTEDRFPSDVVGNASMVGFSFDHDWEMAPGAWTMIVSARGVEIARQDFTIRVPPPGSPNSDC